MNSVDSRLARMAMATGKINAGTGHLVITGRLPATAMNNTTSKRPVPAERKK